MKSGLNQSFGYSLKAALVGCLLFFAAGCVDINDAKVQVQAPAQIDPYNRIALDKCPSHVYPHRLVVAQTGSSSQLVQLGSQMAYNQQDFDKWWSMVSTLGSIDPTTSTPSQQPIVNWDQQGAYFLVIGVGNSCDLTKPMADEMTTDCYSISVNLYRYSEGTNCQPPGNLAVFIYVFPKSTLPVNVVWFYPTPVPTPTPKPIPTLTPTPTPTPETESEDT